MLRKILREFYLLPRGEQRAMILLSLLLILSLGIRVTVRMMPAREPPGMEQFIKESRKIIAALAAADSLSKVKQDSVTETLKKPYPSSSGDYSSRYRPSLPVVSYSDPINLNTTDSAGLLPLPGIGPVFAGRIVKYRNLLGGYRNMEQLSEVYGLSKETILMVSPYLKIDTAEIGNLKVNSAGFRELLRHPYLEYEDVKALVKYRDFVLQIESLQELRDNHLVPDSTLEKVGPYLEFSH